MLPRNKYRQQSDILELHLVYNEYMCVYICKFVYICKYINTYNLHVTFFMQFSHNTT